MAQTGTLESESHTWSQTHARPLRKSCLVDCLLLHQLLNCVRIAEASPYSGLWRALKFSTLFCLYPLFMLLIPTCTLMVISLCSLSFLVYSLFDTTQRCQRNIFSRGHNSLFSLNPYSTFVSWFTQLLWPKTQGSSCAVL